MNIYITFQLQARATVLGTRPGRCYTGREKPSRHRRKGPMPRALRYGRLRLHPHRLAATCRRRVRSGHGAVLLAAPLRARGLAPPLRFRLLCRYVLPGQRSQRRRATSPETRIAWFKISQACLLPALTAGTCFVLEYVYPGRWLTHRNLALLAIPPLLLALLIFAGNGQLIWATSAVSPTGAVMRETATGGNIFARLRGRPDPARRGRPALAVRPLAATSLAGGDDAGRAARGPHARLRRLSSAALDAAL